MYRRWLTFQIQVATAWMVFLLGTAALRRAAEVRSRRKEYAGKHAAAKAPKRRDGNGRHRREVPTPLLRQVLVFKSKPTSVDGLHKAPVELAA